MYDDRQTSYMPLKFVGLATASISEFPPRSATGTSLEAQPCEIDVSQAYTLSI